jgi:cytidyltransferase-like protein
MDIKKKIICFSGRFDPIHAGHVINIQRLAAKGFKVIVVILDYPGREFSAKYIKQIMEEILSRSRGNFQVIINNKHFGIITKKELRKLPKFDIYAAGNLEVLKHVSDLGYEILWVDRAFHYDATTERKAREILKNLTKDKI